MEILVIFSFPDIKDPNSEEADFCIQSLSEDLEGFKKQNGHDWHIAEVLGNDSKNRNHDR